MSFAVALLHNPELLILDEPTVGVDPMLRQNIWNHLLRLCQEQKKTILITTHYIEEARYANTRDFSSFSGRENSIILVIALKWSGVSRICEYRSSLTDSLSFLFFNFIFRQAHYVGLMRHGVLLAEDSPNQLMTIYGLNSLEDVFLRLCVKDDSKIVMPPKLSLNQSWSGKYFKI